METSTNYSVPTKKPLSAHSNIFTAAIAVLAVGLALLTAAAPARAQTAPTIQDHRVENQFPEGMTFRVSVESDSDIEELRLRYKVLPDGTAARGVPDFDPAPSVEAEFFLGQPDVQLPPGTVIEYYWEATDADGDEAKTDVQQFNYDDIRFEWANVSDENVTIYYYAGGEGEAIEMQGVALQTVEEMKALLQTDIPFEVKVWVYETSEDMNPALEQLSEEREREVITAGVRVASDTVLVLGNGSFDTLRHELTHIVTKQAGEGAFGSMPFWLDEGTAVYSQEDKGWFEDAINNAIEDGEAFPIQQITTLAGNPDNVALYYGQGWSIVEHLINTHGEEKFAELFAEMKTGKRIDSALEAVYGFDQDGLEDEWRAANNLPARITATPVEDPEQPAEVVDSADDGGTSTGLIVAVGIGMLALAGAVAFGGITLARRL
jgi:Peptidase MA superfamily